MSNSENPSGAVALLGVSASFFRLIERVAGQHHTSI
jgi:hypothetical protein